MSPCTTDKANQEFRLKFTAPAVLMLNVTEPITNKNALYHQLGTNLAAARRAIEQLQGEEAHAVESGGALGEDVWTAAISAMTDLWTKYSPQELVPGGTAQNPATKDLRKQWNSNVKSSYEKAYAEHHRAAAADRAALAAMAGPPGLPPPPMRANIATPQPQRTPEDGEPDAIDVLLGRMGDNMAAGKDPTMSQDGLLRRTGNGEGAVEVCATAVPPNLAQKCYRLVQYGVPPLRKKRQGPVLANMMLGSKCTFSDWVDMYEQKLKMTGHLLREAQTIGRTLDLSVHQLGPGYLVTDGAEILLRPLLCLVTSATHCGTFKIASTCE